MTEHRDPASKVVVAERVDRNRSLGRLPHLVILAVSVVVLGLSAVMKTEGNQLVYLPGSSIPLPESCTSRLLLGINCPACGLTRGFISISHGRFFDAWSFNPAAYLVYLFFVVQIPWQSLQVWRVRNGLRPIDQIWTYVLPVAMAAALLIQWIIRSLI